MENNGRSYPSPDKSFTCESDWYANFLYQHFTDNSHKHRDGSSMIWAGAVHWFEIMSVKYARGICCSFKAWFHDGEIFRVKLFAKHRWLHLSDSIGFCHFFRFRRE